MTDYLPAMINLEHRLVLPWHRVEFHARRPGWEAERIAHMAANVRPGDVVWDVGAECGDFTALYGTWGCKVLPIEPQPAMWPDLRGTWEANELEPPLWTFQGFLGSAPSDGWEEQLRAVWPPATDGEVVPDPGFKHLAHHTDHVATVSADALAFAVGPPDVLVLDIEGAEYDAMAGAAGLLTDPVHHPRLVYISVHPPTMQEWYGRSEAELHQLMADYGWPGVYLGTHGGEDFWCYQPAAA